MDNIKENNTIHTIINMRDDYTYQDYLDFCESMDIEPTAEEDSTEFYDWSYREKETDYECTMDNLSYCKYTDRYFLCGGDFNAWDGKHRLLGKDICGIVDALKHFTEVDYDNEFIATLDDNDGIIHIRQWSHDDPMGGTCFEIRMFTNQGYEDYLNAWDEVSNIHDFEIKDEWFEKIDWNGLWGA